MTVSGVGAYIGLPKVTKDGELAAPGDAPESVTYKVSTFDVGVITLTIDHGGGWWQFSLAKD